MTNLNTLQSREGFGTWLNEQGLVGIGAEIGVLSGGHARNIIQQWDGQMMHLVDPWAKIDPAIYKEAQTWPVEECYRECLRLAQEYCGRIKLMRMTSLDAAFFFPDAALDWCYIDADHSYEACSADLRAWWPKLRTGGVLGLHDYRTDLDWPQHCDVKRAVDDWRGARPVHHTNVRTVIDPGWCGSVWFVKD